MKLYIDTSDAEEITIGINSKRFVANAKEEKAQMLLRFINSTLQEMKRTMDDITEIEVFEGPGSYTGLRVGVSVAQALGYALNIPVNGKDIQNGETINIKYDK